VPICADGLEILVDLTPQFAAPGKGIVLPGVHSAANLIRHFLPHVRENVSLFIGFGDRPHRFPFLRPAMEILPTSDVGGADQGPQNR
jgi:hypothetical protein